MEVAEPDQDRPGRGRRPADVGRVAGLDVLRPACSACGSVRTTTRRRERRARDLVRTTGPTQVVGTGRIDRKALTDTVRRRVRSIRSCYERGLKRQPDLSGKLTLRFTVGVVGRVTAVKTLADTLGSAEVRRCIESRISRWRFPKPEGGEVVISYPFVFTAAR